jgi:hypothetical protein
VKELRQRLSNPSWFIRQLAQYMGIRCNAEDQITGHFWESRFGMRRLLDEAAVLACLAYVDLNPIKASMVNSLEEYQYVSIGERLRTLDDQSVDSSDWLAPLELAAQTDGSTVTVANRLSRQELAEALAVQTSEPLGCLAMRLQDYADLLRWLSGNRNLSSKSHSSSDVPTILRRLHLDPTEFAEAAHEFGERFSTAAGCPASLAAEAKRRGRQRLHSRGKQSLRLCQSG